MTVIGKKQLAWMATNANETGGSAVSDFARRQLEKYGWREGKGLGKNEDGMSSHVRIKKREENEGIGVTEKEQEEVTDQWWFNAFDSAINKLNKKEKVSKKSKTSKKKKLKNIQEGTQDTYKQMFEETGGARLGMRARADQTAKLQRTENISKHPAATDSDDITATECDTVNVDEPKKKSNKKNAKKVKKKKKKAKIENASMKKKKAKKLLKLKKKKLKTQEE